MTLYTDLNTEYFHICTTGHERISWCYKNNGNGLLKCSFMNCKFSFPSIFVLNPKSYTAYKSSSWTYINFMCGTNNIGYLETLEKIEV